MSSADIISTLAVADAIHDFDRAAKSLLWLIQENLPGFVHKLLAEEESIQYVEEITGRQFENIHAISADAIFRKLGGTATTPIGIVCDASFCSDFVKHLITNKIGKVYIIKNREGSNDQGTNPLFKGHPIMYATDIYNREIIYPAFGNDNSIENKFGSHFELRLSNTKLLIYIDGIEYDSFDFSENTKKGVLEDMNTFHIMLNDIIANQDVKFVWDAQIRFIQKRSGDFLQILSCADKKRLYKIEGSDTTLENCIIYFCSGDRIPCAYSLAVGINTLYISGKGNKIYRNMDDRDSKIEKDFQKLIDNKDNTIHNLEWCITSYKDMVSKLMEKLKEIDTITSLNDIKKYISYAFHYDCILGNYSRIGNEEDMLRKFMSNMEDPYFNNHTNKRSIVFFANNYNFVHKLYSSFTIDMPLYDKIFRDFDPLVYRRIYQEYELSKPHKARSAEEKYVNPYGALYGAAIFTTLFLEPTLHEFVITCVHKIIEFARLAGEENSVKFYKFFLERYVNHHSGGGLSSHKMLTKADYLEMAEECMDFLNDHSCMEMMHMKRLHIRENYRVSVPMTSFVFGLLEYASLEMDLEIPRFLDYYERTPFRLQTEMQQLILKKYRPFLKRNVNRTLRVMKAMKVKARRKQTRKHNRK